MPLTDPVPSSSFDVLERNVQDADKFVNQATGTFTNRVGKEIKPIPVIESEANAAVISLGWHQVGLFADGFTYTLQNDIAKDAAGDWYRWNGTMPKIVTAGTLPSSDANFVKIDYKSHAELSYRNPADGSAHNADDIKDTKNGGSVQDFIDSQYTTAAELATGKFSLGAVAQIPERDGVYDIVVGAADGDINLDAGNGNMAKLRFNKKVTSKQIGLISDFNGVSGTNNSPAYERVLHLAQIGDVFDIREIELNGDLYFNSKAGFTTCVFLLVRGEEFSTNQRPLKITGNANIWIENSTQNTVWMSGPVGVLATQYVSDVNVDSELKIMSAFGDRTAFNDPSTTFPFFGIGFNVSRWYRSEFRFRNEFAKGIVQAPTSDGLYDSGNSFMQQVKVHDCKSNHAQENFMEVTQCWACDIIGNTVERGNGGFDLQRSSNQSCYRLTFARNVLQANKMVNGQQAPFKCNFGVGFTFSGNYFESNRDGVTSAAVPSVFMAPNNVQDLNSLVFEGNFFAQSKTNLDLVGGEFAHVVLDGFRNFYPKGNNFSGGNGYKMTNSSGIVVSEGETYTPFGSIYSEGNVCVASSSIPGVIKLPGIYEDGTYAKANLSKIGFGNSGIMSMQSKQIAANSSDEFDVSPQGIVFISCRFNASANIIIALNSAETPVALSNNTSTFTLSATPTVPAVNKIDIAMNVAKTKLVITSGIASSRKFTVVQMSVDELL